MPPIPLPLTALDYGAAALYLVVVLAIGVYWAAERSSSYFLAARSLSWFPLAGSLAALMAAMAFLGLPAAAYQQGLLCLVIPLSLWIILPVLIAVVLPIYRGLGIASLGEYLELRFDPRLRLLAALTMIAWRCVWLVLVVWAAAHAVAIIVGDAIPLWSVAILIVLIPTLSAALGGLKGVASSGVVHGIVILAGIAAVATVVWARLPGGPERVVEVAGGLGRLQWADFRFDWQGESSLWGALPHFAVLHLLLLAGDPLAGQRLLAARSVDAARTATFTAAVAATVFYAALIYAGLSLLAHYHDHPQEMRPEWVANVDNLTRGPVLGADGKPLIEPEEAISPDNVVELVAQGRLLAPNSKEPFASADGLIDLQSGELIIDKLAMRKPPVEGFRGEVIVRRDVSAKMLPQFVADQMPTGMAGLGLAAILAAALALVDSSVHGISSVIVLDLHRRFGLGRMFLARRLGKSVADLAEADESQLARLVTLGVGIAAALLSIAALKAGSEVLPFEAMTALGAPLLGVFLLGLFTRRCTAAGAVAGLVVGEAVAATMIFLKTLAPTSVPDQYLPGDVWNVTLAAAITIMVGYGASLVLGSRKSHRELRGLVLGCGHSGILAADEEVAVIGGVDVDAEPAREDEIRWK